MYNTKKALQLKQDSDYLGNADVSNQRKRYFKSTKRSETHGRLREAPV